MDREASRQQSLDRLSVLDSGAEASFDGLVHAAAAICGTPIALISLIDHDRQWFKANVGLEGVSETSRAISFCTHAIEQRDLFVVEDAQLDPRFASSPLVTGDPRIRFYAGAPLHLTDGAAVGTLCVIAREPLRLTDQQREVLRQLGRTAVHLLEGRRALMTEGDMRQEAERISSGMPIGLYATDGEGACTFTNPRWQEIFGLSLEESLGSGWADTIHPEDRSAVFAEWTQAAEEAREFEMGFRLLRRDGSLINVHSQAKAFRDPAGVITGFLGFAQDVTSEVALRAELQHQASHDALTQLLNRRAFDACLSQCLQQPAHPGQPGHALLYIDLDQFKIINDAAGHAAGDRLLVQVARLLEAFRSPEASLARLGGDEFGLLLPHCTVAEAEATAGRIIRVLEDVRYQEAEQRFRIGVSIGVVPLLGQGFDPDAVMQAADTSCFAAKESGRNRWHTWGESDADLISRNQAMRWVTRLQRAIDDDRLELHAQRIVPLNPADGDALRAELLLRIREDDGALVMPGAFLPPAERFQLITRLDQWVLQKTIALLAALASLEGIERISLNVSGLSVVDPSFVQVVDAALVDAGPAISQRLCFEITETAAITNVAAAVQFISIVRHHGCTVALDDFGSGMASFGTLKNLTVTHLKIDGQFVTGVIDDPLDDVAVRCFVEVAEVIGLRTVAEFVESEAVLQRLRQIGVHYAQGYHLHRPEPFEQVLAEAMAKRAG
ncbi:putative bifunctional diguanylate cyclase/phosphodiesterase [Vulcanococcus limneticus]|uniref:putative bifunctional diguanylate cyclase/phosphodiesterase n=1 Tax=Vulcanococcus limneticus TaxID=2170428 RepID=UPI00398BFA4B